MAVALQPVTCTTIGGDGNVHFGDVLQLANVASAAFMTCDIEDRVRQFTSLQIFPINLSYQAFLQDTRVGDFSCAVTASPSIGSVACNTFLLAKYCPAQPSIYDREYAGIPHLLKTYLMQHAVVSCSIYAAALLLEVTVAY